MEDLSSSPVRSIRSAVDTSYQTPITSPATSPRKLDRIVPYTPIDSVLRPAISSELLNCPIFDPASSVESSPCPRTRLHTGSSSGIEQQSSNDRTSDEHSLVDAANDTLPDTRSAHLSQLLPSICKSRAAQPLAGPRRATTRRKADLHGRRATDTLDRFIVDRHAVPTKEQWLIKLPSAEQSSICRKAGLKDPFLAHNRNSAGIAHRFATVRHPSLPIRHGIVGTDVRDVPRRVVSTGASWSVAGRAVTEGVLSINNGQGGRLTSGSVAPHYSADFLRWTERHEESLLHERRLAVAIEVPRYGRMLKVGKTRQQSDPYAFVSGSKKTSWKDGRWQHVRPHASVHLANDPLKEIPMTPFRVLDAPTLRDDFYCSLLAYSPTLRCLAVALATRVYLWEESHATSNSTIPEYLLSASASPVTSLSFSSENGGKGLLGIGRNDGTVTIWAPCEGQERFVYQMPVAVSHLSFRPRTISRPSFRDHATMVDMEDLLVRDEQGDVFLFAIEWPSQEQRDLFDYHGKLVLRAWIKCHSQQIYGIAWSSLGDYFATGGNDNKLFVFDHARIEKLNKKTCTQPAGIAIKRSSRDLIYSAIPSNRQQCPTIVIGQEKRNFTLNAAVKAIAFAPWQPSLLAAGGGSNDRCIHFFHIHSGATLATIDCYAQVTSLVWNERRQEIAATLGFAQPEHPFRVAVFAYPSCDMLVSIPWLGEERALYAIPYPSIADKPEQSGIVIATSDSSIKFHKVWPTRKAKPKRNAEYAKSTILSDTCSYDIERAAVIR